MPLGTFHARDAQTSGLISFATQTDPLGADNVEIVAWFERGTWDCAAGVGAPPGGVVDIPTTALLRRVSVVANNTTNTTVQIGSKPVITILAGDAFDEQISGQAIGLDVTIGGGVPQTYYVTWVV